MDVVISISVGALINAILSFFVLRYFKKSDEAKEKLEALKEENIKISFAGLSKEIGKLSDSIDGLHAEVRSMSNKQTASDMAIALLSQRVGTVEAKI